VAVPALSPTALRMLTLILVGSAAFILRWVCPRFDARGLSPVFRST
jgi:hypothetical protein